MNEQPLVSVIIPVYNVERYLAQCLDSVSHQTYQNLEIICVNDGSRDGSPDILRRYADEDARIQVIDKANGGVSRARNDALDCARGEYIMFVDSDDWVEPDACENAVNAMREYDADIVMWSYVSETENRSSRKVIFPETTVFEKEEVRAKLHRRFVGAMGEDLSHPELVDSLCPVWGKLYRRSLIQKSGARFVDLAEIGSYEDGFFNLEVFGKADRVVYLAAYPILNAVFGTGLLSLGIYLPLLTVEPLLTYRFGRVQETVHKAVSKGLRITVGYALLLVLLGCVREWLSAGTVFGAAVGSRALLPMASMPAGGFIVLGVLCAVWRALAKKRREYLEKEARSLVAVNHQKEAERGE